MTLRRLSWPALLLWASCSCAFATPEEKKTPPSAAEVTARAILDAKDEKELDRLLAKAQGLKGSARAALIAWIATHTGEARLSRLVQVLAEFVEEPAAREVLARLARIPFDGPPDRSVAVAALQVIGEFPADAALAVLVAGLQDSHRSVDDAHQEALVNLLATPSERGDAVRPFCDYVQRRESDLASQGEEAKLKAFRKLVQSLIERAFLRRDRIETMVRELTDAPSPTLRIALLGAIRPRLHNQARELSTIRLREEQRRKKLSDLDRNGLVDLDTYVEDQIRATPRLGRLRESLLAERRLLSEALVKVCTSSEDPQLVVAGLGVVPEFTSTLTAEWAPYLLDLLDHPEPKLREAAYRLLVKLTKQKFTPNRSVWLKWWQGQEKGS
ncbi:MAG: hypothetical protein AB7N76_30610 [Planctomycetota bacterium]